MDEIVHPALTDNLPWFMPGPDGSDTLMTITAVSVSVSIVLIGVLFLSLHSLPERMGHKKLQFEIVSVLALLSLLTHNHTFWIVGLLLALIDLPDFLGPLRRIAASAEAVAGIAPAPADMPDDTGPPVVAAAEAEEPVFPDAEPAPEPEKQG
jgi:hypothetical protein